MRYKDLEKFGNKNRGCMKVLTILFYAILLLNIIAYLFTYFSE